MFTRPAIIVLLWVSLLAPLLAFHGGETGIRPVTDQPGWHEPGNTVQPEFSRSGNDDLSDPLKRAIIRHLESVYPEDGYRFDVELKHVPASLANRQSGRDYRISFNTAMPSGYEIALVQEEGGSGVSGAERIQVQITLQALVPVASRTITAGETIGYGDLKTVWRDVTRFNEPVFTDAREVVGMTSARRILRDSPVLHSHVHKKETLKSGNRLQMLYRENGLLIELPVVLRQNADPGQAARAFHQATGRHFEIRIINHQQAEWLRTL